MLPDADGGAAPAPGRVTGGARWNRQDRNRQRSGQGYGQTVCGFQLQRGPRLQGAFMVFCGTSDVMQVLVMHLHVCMSDVNAEVDDAPMSVRRQFPRL